MNAMNKVFQFIHVIISKLKHPWKRDLKTQQHDLLLFRFGSMLASAARQHLIPFLHHFRNLLNTLTVVQQQMHRWLHLFNLIILTHRYLSSQIKGISDLNIEDLLGVNLTGNSDFIALSDSLETGIAK